MSSIFLVLDDQLGSRILELSREHYVWVVESATNKPWIDRAWVSQNTGTDASCVGLSSFARYAGETDDEVVIRLMEMIDEHHGEYEQDPPWSEIQVIGARSSQPILDSARNYGVEALEETSEGFRVVRAVGSGQ